ncbi:MAG: class I SAM-dependent methyltransferase [candidate division Zixibacteria bacterium]|nr:class I SAM-dependent methyltransferase [candidate division Zixibacteria bacterium]
MTDFSTIAKYYDLMTGFDRRLVREFGVIKHLVDKFKIARALDAGCGTGVHTIILAKIGVDVVGVDSSPEMLEIARTNALKEGIKPPFCREYFESLPAEWDESFDGVFCLANSLVGVQTAERLSLSLQAFHRVLKPGGHVIIQLLNLAGFRRLNRRIIKVSSEQNLTFVRFLDFDELDTRLNILVLEHELGEVRHTFSSQSILPIMPEVLSATARINHYSQIQFFGDLALVEAVTPDSENLVALLTR